ncbi:MAG: hypothetical protein HQL48_10655, partial [Gammaproteobacteria bacterium]|nr:hypothetical protein [Gammaproteobacteria bacterium]
GFVLESYVEEIGKSCLAKSLADGKIDKSEFDDGVKVMVHEAKGKLDQAECQRRLKKIAIEGDMKIKEGFLKGGGWFSKIPD